MATAHDVAAYILEKCRPLSAMKLQKLVYYSQAWSLVWEGRPLFGERIEAWANGPVVRELYEWHRGMFEIHSWPDGDPQRLSAESRKTIDAVLNFYGDKSARWLSDLTHGERPWKQARAGVPSGSRSDAEITTGSMLDYYSQL